MRSVSMKSVISPTCSFAPVTASPARLTASATSGSRFNSSTLRVAGADGAGDAGGGEAGLGGGCSDIQFSVLGCPLSAIRGRLTTDSRQPLRARIGLPFFLHQSLQHVERLGFSGNAEGNVVGLTTGDRIRVAFA